MIMIELDAFEAFIEAIDAMDTQIHVSPREIGLALRRLYTDGWQLTRCPPIEPTTEPPQIASPNSTAWPPSGLTTRLWATGMIHNPDRWMQIESVFELTRSMECNASLIGADTLAEAQAYWRDRGNNAPDAEFVVNGVTFRYYSDLIPF